MHLDQDDEEDDHGTTCLLKPLHARSPQSTRMLWVTAHAATPLETAHGAHSPAGGRRPCTPYHALPLKCSLLWNNACRSHFGAARRLQRRRARSPRSTHTLWVMAHAATALETAHEAHSAC